MDLHIGPKLVAHGSPSEDYAGSGGCCDVKDLYKAQSRMGHGPAYWPYEYLSFQYGAGCCRWALTASESALWMIWDDC